MVSILKLE